MLSTLLNDLGAQIRFPYLALEAVTRFADFLPTMGLILLISFVLLGAFAVAWFLLGFALWVLAVALLVRLTAGAVFLAVPARVRGAKGDGDRVRVEFSFDPDDD